MNWLKAKAGALQLTLFIVVVIALLLASFVILVHLHKRFNIQSHVVIETVQNANRGIYYVIDNSIPKKDTTIVNLNDEDYKTLTLHRDFWGLFEKVISVSQIKTSVVKKMALIGAIQPKLNRTALYLENHDKPLVVVGNTRIEGIAYLSEKGIKPGNISGNSYYGQQLIYGRTKLSDKLPELLAETITNFDTEYKKLSFDNSQLIDLNSKRLFENSFLNPLQIAYSNETLTLSNISVTGHFIIQSQKKIIVEATTNLKDVILIAPVIEIKNNTSGNFQAFANKSITIGNNCNLKYPSVLVLNEDEEFSKLNKEEDYNHINIGSKTILNGIVLVLGSFDANNYKPQLILEEQSLINGEIYCKQNIELKGDVNGSVYAANFLTNQSGSIFQNHIYNVTINSNKLSQEYVGLPFKNLKKGVLQWLY